MQFSLIEFSVENYKVFKERATLSMIARKSDHTFENNGENLLKTTFIYGPNASGKSVLFEALNIMKGIIIQSANNTMEDIPLPYPNFIFSEDTENRPVFWEIVFSLGDNIYKYNFSILKEKILQENLFGVLTDGKLKKYLIRNNGNIELFEELKNSQDVIPKTKEKVLFLSAAFQWNNKFVVDIIDGLRKLYIVQGVNSDKYASFTLELFKEASKKEQILNLLKKADFSIIDGEVKDMSEQVLTKIKTPDPSLQEDREKFITIDFSHKVFDSDKNEVGSRKINIGEESVGTQKFFNILGLILDVINSGKVLFIDEFDNSLHPLLTKFIVDIFEKNNSKNAQLIVTTHDTSLLSYKDDFDKAQFWFTEKDNIGSAKLFSLAEFNEIRNDTGFYKKYLEGRFGALPLIEKL